MNNLPAVAVHDIMIHPIQNDIIIGTHGRGIWICDDITPLQSMTDKIKASEAYIFDQRIATQWDDISRGGNRGQFLFQGENPPRGAVISCYLKDAAEEAKLIISDWEGKQKLEVELKDQSGINKYVWPFEFNPPELNEEEKELFDRYLKTSKWQERREISEQLQESLEKRGEKFAGIGWRSEKLNKIPAEPGVYKVTLTVGDTTVTKPLTVRADPKYN